MARKDKKKSIVLPTQTTKVNHNSTTEIITRIIEQSNNRAKKDISTWRAALTSAENRNFPNRNRYYDLCEELVLDNHVRNLQKRLYRMIAKNKLAFVAKDKINEDLSKLLSGKWFQNFVRYCVDSRLYGHSLIEFVYENDKIYCYLIPRKHVLPELGGFRDTPYDTQYIEYRGDEYYKKFTIEVGEPQDLGDLMAAAPNILFKKNATIAWSEYTEIFGMPMRVGKTNSKNVTDLDRMEGQMIGMGKAAYAVIDSQEEIDFVESTKGDAYQVFDMLIERMNSELSKLFLGETLTTDVGRNGSRAQSEVHQDVSYEVEAELQQWFLNILNEDLLPVLGHLGLPVNGLEIQYINNNNSELEDDKWLNENFDIDPQFWADKYNVPITGYKEKEATEKKSEDINEEKMKEAKELADKIENFVSNPIIQMHAQIQELYNHSH